MLRWAVLLVVALPLLYLAAMVGASEFAEEVVVLHTVDDRDGEHQTSLWIVEDGLGGLWLRAGMPDSGWLMRIELRPEVELERDGVLRAYTAEPVPEDRDRIHRLMRERYGWSDRVISALRDGGGSVPVRLVERE